MDLKSRPPKQSARPDVRLEIGELLLDGFAPADRHRIGDACQHELSRLLGERGLPGMPNAGALAERSISITAGRTPESTGRALAAALHTALSRSSSDSSTSIVESTFERASNRGPARP